MKSFLFGRCCKALLPLIFIPYFIAAPVSPSAAAANQDAVTRGMAAVQQQDWPLAIKYFTAALEQSPSPVLLKNLALAYDKAGGRELIAICYYRAFLDAQPASPDAASVRQRIPELEVKVESNMRALADEAAKAAESLPREGVLAIVNGYQRWNAAIASAAAGNIARAQELHAGTPDAAPAGLAIDALDLFDFKGATVLLSGADLMNFTGVLMATPDPKVIPFGDSETDQARDFFRAAEQVVDNHGRGMGDLYDGIESYLTIGERLLSLGDVAGAERVAKKSAELIQFSEDNRRGDIAIDRLLQEKKPQLAELQSGIAGGQATAARGRKFQKIAWQTLAKRLIEQKPSDQFRYVTEAPADLESFLVRVKREAADAANAQNSGRQNNGPEPIQDMAYGVEDLALGLLSVEKQMLIRRDRSFVVVP